MATNWIVKSYVLSAILSILLVQGCSSEFADSYMKGYTEAVLGKDYISGPTAATTLGQYEKTLEVCKEHLSPQKFGLYTADVSWYKNYIDNASEQKAYMNAYISTAPKADECKKISYEAEAIHNIRLDQQRESEIQQEQRKSKSSQTNCIETHNGLSCNTTQW